MAIDLSGINPANPVEGAPTTASVRDNFAAIKGALEELDQEKANADRQWVLIWEGEQLDELDISSLGPQGLYRGECDDFSQVVSWRAGGNHDFGASGVSTTGPGILRQYRMRMSSAGRITARAILMDVAAGTITVQSLVLKRVYLLR
jgi:hypothetical protein